MTPEIQTLLITIVFLSQIVVLSFLAPIRFRRLYTKLYDSYPETEYPRFYPVPRVAMERQLSRYLLIRMATGPIGMAALILGLVYGGDPQQLARIMGAVLIVQILSGIVGYRWRPGILRAMSRLPPPARRSAELRRWRITDFVSPALIVAGLVSVLSVFAAAGYVFFVGQGDGGIIGFAIGGALPIATGYLAWMLIRIWKPVSLVPSVSSPPEADLFRQRQRGFRVLFVAATVTGLALSIVLLAGAGTIGLDFLCTRLAVSLLAQVLVVVVPSLGFRTIRSLDFSEYRAA
jgi:hypothetical protein